MKKFLNIITVFLVVFSFHSCEDELDQLPNNAFAPESFYKTNQDFEFATRALYSGLFSGSYYGGSLLSRPDITSDNVVVAQVGRKSNLSFYEWRYKANTAWNMMGSAYVVINRANQIIDKIDNLVDGSIKDNYFGEAHAVRALAHFDLLRVYSRISDSNSLGMPYVKGIDPNYEAPRPTVNETLTQIIADLEAAKGLVGTSSTKSRFTVNAVNALLSRVYLYAGQYQNSIDAANAVTTSIAKRNNFAQVWTDSSTDGVILKLDQNASIDDIGVGIDWSQSSASGIIPEYVWSYNFVSSIDSSDIRGVAYNNVIPDADGKLYNAIIKYYGEAGQQNGSVDAKILRAAEVYLNKAEALYFSNNEAAALTALDELRENRYQSFVTGGETGVDLISAIQYERRIELAAEGHRLFDMRRWGMGISRSTTEGEFNDGTGTPAIPEARSLSAGDYRMVFPIPQSQINIYSELQQNPDY
jgi:starch-binding outer membrane protein, SusD/RagB family